MPITQERLYESVQIASRAHDAIRNASGAVRDWQQSLFAMAMGTNVPPDFRQALLELSDRMGRYLAEDFTLNPIDIAHLAEEHYHYKLMSGRNARNRQYIAEKRAGVPKGERTKRPGQSTPGNHRAPQGPNEFPSSLPPSPSQSATANPSTLALPTGLLTSDFTPEELEFFRREAEQSSEIVEGDLDL